MNAYLFDVDGVLTNMEKRKIDKPEIIPLLISLLQKGSPLGFISGRGMLWLRSNLVKMLENYLNDHPGFKENMLDNVFVSAEFGGVFCAHKNGIREETVNREFTIPDEVKRGLHFVAFQYSDIVYVETEKQTIFTVVGNHDLREEDFKSKKNLIIEAFKQVLIPFPYLEVQTDRLAINVRYKKANKSYATDMFLSFLIKKNLTTEKFFVFGDSPTDLEMGVELQKQQKSFEFIYVGEQSELEQSNPAFQITFTKRRCDEGTLEYFTSKLLR